MTFCSVFHFAPNFQLDSDGQRIRQNAENLLKSETSAGFLETKLNIEQVSVVNWNERLLSPKVHNLNEI